MAMSSSRAAAKGFTLVEVLVSLAVLAIAMAAVMRVIGQAIDITAGLRDRQIALGVAQDQLVLHFVKHDWPSADTHSGDRDQAGRKWRWTEKVTATDYPGIRRIEIEVRAADSEYVLAGVTSLLRKP